jgi:hypothetical protein
MRVLVKFTGSSVNPNFPEKTWEAYCPCNGTMEINIPSIFGLTFSNVNKQLEEYFLKKGIYGAKWKFLRA